MKWLHEVGFNKISDSHTSEFMRRVFSWQNNLIDESQKHIFKLGVPKKIDSLRYIKLIRRLTNAGVRVRNRGNSLYLNRISPGCLHCGQAANFTIELSKECNRNCFFCFDKRPYPYVKRTLTQFVHAKKLLFERRKFVPLRSFAISGGEPLLVFENVLKCLKLVKKITNGVCQTRIYTNGDLLDEDKLKRLKNVGLDEIRISLKPECMDTKSLVLAKKYIPRVMVEMPVFSDKKRYMENLLVRLNKLEIFGINLLEFLYCEHHTEEYKNKGYYLKSHKPKSIIEMMQGEGNCYPVAGSEEACLELLEFAISKKLSIGVHYCSFENKQYPYRKYRLREARIYKLGYQSISGDGFLKSLVIFEPNWFSAYKKLKEFGVRDREISISRDKKDKERFFMYVHPRNKRFLDKHKYTMAILYSFPLGQIVNAELV